MGLSRDRTTLEQEAIDKVKSNKGLSCESLHTLTIDELPTQTHGKHNNVNHPAHYNSSEAKCTCGRRIECIDVTRHLNFNIGNAMKYLWRCDAKGHDIEDLQKALWYINDELAQRAGR